MSTRETDSQFDAEVARIKRMAIQRSVRVNWMLGVSSVAAVVVAGAVWFRQRPVDRELDLSLGLGFATFCLGCILGRFLLPIPRAECPQCGCDWRVESENDLQKWLAWRCCPTCGLKMTDDAGLNEKS